MEGPSTWQASTSAPQVPSTQNSQIPPSNGPHPQHLQFSHANPQNSPSHPPYPLFDVAFNQVRFNGTRGLLLTAHAPGAFFLSWDVLNKALQQHNLAIPEMGITNNSNTSMIHNGQYPGNMPMSASNTYSSPMYPPGPQPSFTAASSPQSSSFLPSPPDPSSGASNYFSPSHSFLPPTGVLSRTNGHTLKRGRATEHPAPYSTSDRSSLTSLDSGDEMKLMEVGHRPLSLQYSQSTGPGRSGPGTPGFSMLNENEENYVWDRQDAQLYPANSERGRAAVGRPHNDTITFTPRSYTRVFEQDHEIFPSTGNSNAWLKHQSCLPNCRFRSKGKRPAVIRAHLATCKLRTSLENDPLKRLCKLQMDAMRHKRAHMRPGEDSVDLTSEGNDTEDADTDHTDHTRSSSEISFDPPDGAIQPINLSKDANAAASLGLSLTITDNWPESLPLFGFDPLTDTSADLLSALPTSDGSQIQIPPGLTFSPMY